MLNKTLMLAEANDFRHQAENIARALNELGLEDPLVTVKRDRVPYLLKLSEACTDSRLIGGTYPVLRRQRPIGSLVRGSFDFQVATTMFDHLGYRLATSAGRYSNTKLTRAEVQGWADQLMRHYRADERERFEDLIHFIFAPARAHHSLIGDSYRRSSEWLADQLVSPRPPSDLEDFTN